MAVLQTEYRATEVLQTEYRATEVLQTWHARVCVELQCDVFREMGGIIQQTALWLCTVLVSGETGREGRVMVMWNGQCELTELLTAINWTA
jgi:hypothetical protein